MPEASARGASESETEWTARTLVYEAYLQIDSLISGMGATPRWLGTGFWFQPGGEGAPLLVDPEAGTIGPLLDCNKVRSALSATNGDGEADAISFDGVSADGRCIRVKIDGRLFNWDRQTQRLQAVSYDELAREAWSRPRIVQSLFPETAPPMTESLSPDSTELLSLVEGNLALRRADREEARVVTDDASGHVRYATNRAVWSRDGKWVATLRADATHVGRVPIVEWQGRREEVVWRPYARVGDPIEEQRAILIDRIACSTSIVRTGDAPHYIFLHGFSGDPERLLLSRQSRDGKVMELLATPTDGRDLQVVVREVSQTYFGASIVDEAGGGHCQLLRDGFLWLSERDGWRHIYRYSLDGALIGQLTQGAFPVAQILRVDDEWVYYLARADSAAPYCASLHRVRLSGGASERLTPDPGDHSIDFAPDGRYFIDSHSTVTDPGRTDLRRADGSFVLTLATGDITRLRAVGWRAPEPFTAMAADGETVLHGVVYKPHDWSAEQRYPVVQYVYGGPQRAITPRSFLPVNHGTYLRFAQALAQLGFIVVVVDARGTPERCRAFQDAAFGRLGSFEIDDYASVLSELSERDATLDMSRVGVFGISFGGYFATRALLLRPDIYRVGVACAPAVEMRDVYAKASEVFLGDPVENQRAYDDADNTRLVERLQGRLLIIQGSHDVNVPMAQSMRLVSALIAADKPFDFLLMPGLNHIFQPEGAPATTFRHPYLWAAIRRFLVGHLKPSRSIENSPCA